MKPPTHEITIREWDRKPGESPRWYARYLLFQNLGSNRTLAAAEAQSCGKTEGKSPSGAWKRAATDFEWMERARAWDLHIALRAMESSKELLHRQRLASLRVVVGFTETVERFLGATDPTEKREALAKVEALAGKGRGLQGVLETLHAFADEMNALGTQKTNDDWIKNLKFIGPFDDDDEPESPQPALPASAAKHVSPPPKELEFVEMDDAAEVEKSVPRP